MRNIPLTRLIFTIILFSCMMTACSSSLSTTDSIPKTEDQAAEKTLTLLGTTITLKAYGTKSEEALIAAESTVSRINELMSVNEPTSEVSRINQSTHKEAIEVSSETAFVISHALEYALLTEGAFDPSIGHMIDLWGIGTDHARIPAKSELAPFINKKLYHSISLTTSKDAKKTSSVFLSSPLAKLDLGGIAKGFAGDAMKKVLTEEYGITSALLNLGGNVVTIGTKPDGSDWIIGLQDPFNSARGNIIGKISIPNKSIVTSGNYERYFEENGKRYHHILDASTGYPSDSDVASSTIIADEGIDADALSTSVYILGKDKGLALIESLDNIEAIIITKDKHVYTTPGITENMFTLTQEGYTYEKRK